MTSAPDSRPRFLGLSPMAAAILLIGVTTVFRFCYASWLPVLPDETYYLQWAHHLDVSYISKGPAVAWAIALGTVVFGDNNFGVRFFAVLLSAATAWQIFQLGRRWFDDVTALIAVLVSSIVPIYAIGAVVMTIDPISVFFWGWAANFFSRALVRRGVASWVMAGFAVGCGFLGKYLNLIELLSFLAFLLIVPARRRLLGRPGFWLMLLTALLCTLPVIWWNAQHHWIGFDNLKNRGHLNTPGPFLLTPSTFIQFLTMQAVVISPLLFVALLVSVGIACARKFLRRDGTTNEAELFLVLLFAPVFLMYAALSWHTPSEPNWPAVSYLSLVVLLASHWRKMLLVRKQSQPFIVLTFCLGWLQTTLLQDTAWLPLPAHADPMSRVAGWREIAGRLDDLRTTQHTDVIIADAYKEASVLSYYLPHRDFIFSQPHDPPANQYDLWPSYPTNRPALWITAEPTPYAMLARFNSITWLEHDTIYFRGRRLRAYDIYLCQNKPQP